MYLSQFCYDMFVVTFQVEFVLYVHFQKYKVKQYFLSGKMEEKMVDAISVYLLQRTVM
jgi:hypothetical protein